MSTLKVRPFAMIGRLDKDDYWFLVPEKDWKKGLEPLYKPLLADCVERTQIEDDSKHLRWMWLDENGLARGQFYNSRATKLYWRKRQTLHEIVGMVAIEQKTLIMPEDQSFWVSFLAHEWPILSMSKSPLTVVVHVQEAAHR